MLDYASLHALAVVVTEGSFERAARVLNVTPSAISQRIRLLEERVGHSLVVREHPCRATDMGQRLCQHVDIVRLLEQELQSDFPTLTEQDRTKVTLPIAINADSFATWFVPVLAEFSKDSGIYVSVSVDDQDHTADWLRSGKVLAAVTGTAHSPTGCNSVPLGVMRYRAAASPEFIDRYFSEGVNAETLARAPSLLFNSKDELQARWAKCHCDRPTLDLPKHVLPSSEAFVTATELNMGWGMHPEALIRSQLKEGTLVELIEDSPFDVPLYWHYVRSASTLVEGLTRAVESQAKICLIR